MRYGRDPTVDLRFQPHYVYKPLEVSEDVFTRDSTVYFMDYCGAPGVLSSVAAKVKKLVLLDHHKTAAEAVAQLKEQKAVPENAEIVLDMERSGATISYDYLQPWKYWSVDESKGGEAGQEATKAALDRVYKLVEDNDLWRHVVPGSRDFAAGIGASQVEPDFSKNPKIFEQLVQVIKDPESILRKGEEARKEEEKACEEACKSAFVLNLGGPDSGFGQCLAACPANPKLRSPVGNALAKYSKEKGLRAMSALFYVEPEMPDTTTVWKVSLRSIGAEETTAICKFRLRTLSKGKRVGAGKRPP